MPRWQITYWSGHKPQPINAPTLRAAYEHWYGDANKTREDGTKLFESHLWEETGEVTNKHGDLVGTITQMQEVKVYTEVIITIASTKDSAGHEGEILTKVFRMEFESLQDAENFIDTSHDPRGLLNVQEMGIGSIK